MPRREISSLKGLFFVALPVLVLLSMSLPAQAIENGQSDVSNKFTVRIDLHSEIVETSDSTVDSVTTVTTTTTSISARCTGVQISARVVLTAAHCFYSEVNNDIFTVDEIFINSTGNTSIPNGEHPLSINLNPQYIDGHLPNPNSEDIAYLILKSDHPLASYLSIANSGQIESIIKNASAFRVYGYGPISDTNSDAPSSVQSYEGTASPPIDDSKTGAVVRSKIASSCLGDSGGPVTAVLDKKELLIGMSSLLYNPNQFCGMKTDSDYFLAQFVKVGRYSQFIALAKDSVPNSLPKKSVTDKAPMKKTTMSCHKGKLVKRVSGNTPKCPVGYKVKR